MSEPLGTDHLFCANCRNRRWVVDFGFGRLCSACAQLRHATGAWCPIFVDARGVELDTPCEQGRS